MKIAVVEDDKGDRDLLLSHIRKYGEEKSLGFVVDEFDNPVPFLNTFSNDYDIVFLDIKMPMMNGMDCAKEIRKKDSEVIIIFITSLAQYALIGYEVEALDYVIKPINYSEFVIKFSRAVSKARKNTGKTIVLSSKGNKTAIDENEIIYAESRGHKLYIKTVSHEYEIYESLSKFEQKLSPNLFAKCNSCYIVNLKYVIKIAGFDVTVGTPEGGTDVLQISQPKKKDFQKAFVKYKEGV